MLKIVLLGLILLVVISMGWFFFLQGSSSNKVTKEGPVIFFGDSLTSGVGVNPGEDFPTLVARNLNLTNVINAGVSGDTTEDALARLQKDVLDKNPALVVILLGGNDFLKGVPIEKTISNVDKIVKRTTETNSAVILVHLRSNPLNDKYKEPTKKIAAKYQIELVTDILKGILGNSSLLSDNIHPNAAGYKVMAERITPTVKKVLE